MLTNIIKINLILKNILSNYINFIDFIIIFLDIKLITKI